jgi:hypothetical protein
MTRTLEYCGAAEGSGHQGPDADAGKFRGHHI